MITLIKNYFLKKKIKKIINSLPRILLTRYSIGPYTGMQLKKTFEELKLDKDAYPISLASFLTINEFNEFEDGNNYYLLCDEIQKLGFCSHTPEPDSSYYFDLGHDDYSNFSSTTGNSTDDTAYMMHEIGKDIGRK
jgi:hypothetical protein